MATPRATSFDSEVTAGSLGNTRLSLANIPSGNKPAYMRQGHTHGATCSFVSCLLQNPLVMLLVSSSLGNCLIVQQPQLPTSLHMARAALIAGLVSLLAAGLLPSFSYLLDVQCPHPHPQKLTG